MRITQGMLSQQMLTDIQSNLQRLGQLQTEAATGKKINKPSDDPVGVGFVMDYNNQLAEYQQAGSNAASAGQSLNYASSVMTQAVQVIQRVHDLAVQGASDSLSTTDRQAIGQEVGQLYQHMVSLGNTQFNGYYIFNGQQVTSAPYNATTATTATTDAGQVLYDLGDNVTLPVNVDGNAFFGDAVQTGQQATSDNAFNVLQNLQTALNNNDTATIESSIGLLDSRMNTMLATQADMGARMNRTQLAQTRISGLSDNVEALLANTQDADMATVAVQLQASENVQTAALQVGAKVIVPSLVDFLK